MAADPIWASVNTDGTFVSPKVQAAIDARAKAAIAPLLDEERRARWTVTRDHTLIFAVEDASDVAVNPERNTLTFQIGA